MQDKISYWINREKYEYVIIIKKKIIIKLNIAYALLEYKIKFKEIENNLVIIERKKNLYREIEIIWLNKVILQIWIQKWMGCNHSVTVI